MSGRISGEGVVCAIAGLAAVAFLVWRAQAFFPNAHGLLGHDYAWFLPTLVTGHFWHRQNGWLTVPLFTPAFCGGVPFLANPQSVFYSMPQWLLLVLEPSRAMFATLLISACGGAAGCYLLLRRYFTTSIAAATLGASLFLLNGFLFYRLAVGHLTYYTFAVVPLLACLLVSGQTVQWAAGNHAIRRLLLAVVLGSVLIAGVSYGGGVNLLAPIVLSVAIILLIFQIERGFRRAPWFILAASCLWGGLISAMKLVPSLVFVSQFPRPYLPQYLFQNPVMMALTLGAAFFMPNALPDGIRFPSGEALGRHEFEFGLSIVPLPLGAVAMWHLRGLRVRSGTRIQWVVLTALLLMPMVLTFGPSGWGHLLLSVPVINNNTTFVRWWAIYLLPLLILTARCFDVVARTPARRSALVAACIAVALGQHAVHNPQYYVDPSVGTNAYDPAAVTDAYRQLRSGKSLPNITRIGLHAPIPPTGLAANDAFVAGASALPCYEPVFGYDLELLPGFGLVEGPIIVPATDERLNIVDASTYLIRAGQPAASRRFHVSRLDAARAFAAYRPYDWNEPWWHAAASWMTVAASAVLVACLACLVPGVARRLASAVMHAARRAGG